AEDGIRDDLVTGVQTCALPISDPEPAEAGLHTEVSISPPLKPFAPHLWSAAASEARRRFGVSGRVRNQRKRRRRCALPAQSISQDRKSVVEGKRCVVGRRGICG